MFRKAPIILGIYLACTMPVRAQDPPVDPAATDAPKTDVPAKPEPPKVDPALLRMAQAGIAAFQKGDYSNAIRYLTARAKMRPEDANVYYYLGNCYLKTKQHEHAAHMFSASVRVAPSSQAGKYALTALETLSTMPKTAAEPVKEDNGAPDAAQTSANKESLMSEKALDQAFNENVNKIKGYRQGLKSRVDQAWLQMQDEMQSLQQKNNPTYAVDLEKLQRETENKVQDMQTKELRLENRLLAPDKIDVRAIPQLPTEKIDDTKTALGSLLDYFKPEKPFDPFATDITPEMTSKFLTVKDVFGELPTYQGSARRLAKQVFIGLKSNIETKQNMLDQQLFQLKANLIHDVVNIKNNFGSSQSNHKFAVNVASYITGAKVPRSDRDQLSPMELEIHQAVERSKKRIKELEETYYREVDNVIAGAKEKLGGMVAQTGQMNSQLQKPSGNIQLVPQGTDMYTRNYVNFGDRPDMTRASTSVTGKLNKIPAASVPLHAEAKKLTVTKRVGRPESSKNAETKTDDAKKN